ATLGARLPCRRIEEDLSPRRCLRAGGGRAGLSAGAPMSVENEVRALEGLGLHDLREVWRGRFGAPPRLRSPDLLRRCLAWRIQTLAYGGIEPGLRRRLRGEGRV